MLLRGGMGISYQRSMRIQWVLKKHLTRNAHLIANENLSGD